MLRTPINEEKAWPAFGVAFMAVLSALLNGFANSTHAPNAAAGWAMGFSVPCIVLVLAKVAGSKWRKAQRFEAFLSGGSGISLLALSVWHCSESIAALTGTSQLMAGPMAIAIDAGLVACEIALLRD
jgi:hypothetical protein